MFLVATMKLRDCFRFIRTIYFRFIRLELSVELRRDLKLEGGALEMFLWMCWKLQLLYSEHRKIAGESDYLRSICCEGPVLRVFVYNNCDK